MIALVTDGDTRAALAITRSLGRRGVSVLIGEEHPRSLASSSRYAARHVTYPSPYRDPEAFARCLLDIVGREQVDVVIPVTDVTTHCIAANRCALETRTAVAAPPLEAFEEVTDKERLLGRAESCDIPVPRTHVVDGAAGFEAIAGEIDYPVVIKSIRSRLPTMAGWVGTEVHYAARVGDARRIYHDVAYLGSHRSIVQERIVGPGIGVFVLFDRGRLVTAFAHRRLREKPPSGGVSVLRESIALDPRLADQAARLLGPLGWHGVAMLEFKQDRRTGTPYLLEVNGRFWGSLQLAIDAGVDFPWLSAELALRRPVQVAPAYRVGVRSRWLLGDLDHLLARLFKPHAAQHLAAGTPSRLKTLLDFLKIAQRDLHYEIERREDPGPFLYEVRCYARDLRASAVRGVRALVGAGGLPRGRQPEGRAASARGETHAGALR